jgi:hypothetical protein
MITADMSANGKDRIISGNSRLTLVSPLAGPTMLMEASAKHNLAAFNDKRLEKYNNL